MSRTGSYRTEYDANIGQVTNVSALVVSKLPRVNYAFTGSGESTHFFCSFSVPQTETWQLKWFTHNCFNASFEVNCFQTAVYDCAVPRP